MQQNFVISLHKLLLNQIICFVFFCSWFQDKVSEQIIYKTIFCHFVVFLLFKFR